MWENQRNLKTHCNSMQNRKIEAILQARGTIYGVRGTVYIISLAGAFHTNFAILKNERNGHEND